MNHHDEDTQIRASVERLLDEVSGHWRQQLTALRTAIDQQISSIEAALDDGHCKPDISEGIERISRLAAEHANGDRPDPYSIAGQSLASIEAALHARLGSEAATNAMLRSALSDARQQLESVQCRAASELAERNAMEARYHQVLNENQQLIAALMKAQALPGDAVRPKPLQFSEPARDAKRFKIRRGILVNVDGIAGELVDLSMGGAQTLLTQGVKPNQLVRLVLPAADGQIICKGRIVWAVYEQPATSVSVYRSGVKFTDVDGVALERFMNDFCEKPTLGQSRDSTQSAAKRSR